MFLHLSVILSTGRSMRSGGRGRGVCGGRGVHGGGECAWWQGGHAWQGGVCGGRGACMVVGGMCGGRGCMYGSRGDMRGIQWDMVNEQVVHILLECILVIFVSLIRSYFIVSVHIFEVFVVFVHMFCNNSSDFHSYGCTQQHINTSYQ